MEIDGRNVRFGGEELGVLSFKKIFRLATKGQIDATAELWSEREEKWLLLRFLRADCDPTPAYRVQQMIDADIPWAQFKVGTKEECLNCRALADKKFRQVDAPSIPPDGCSCFPCCSCYLIAVLDDD